MKNVATYDSSNDAWLDDCAKVNFIYGANGSGKSTISNYLQDITSPKYSDCSIEWTSDSIPELVVYNKSFRDKNFSGDIAGVFTLGEATIEDKQELEDLKAKREYILSEIEKAKGSLEIKKQEKDRCNSIFRNDAWNLILKENEKDFQLVFSGYRGSKEKFASEVLTRFAVCHDSIETRENLVSKSKSLLTNKPETCPIIDFDIDDLFTIIQEIEEADIWTKVVVGNKDIPISKLIAHLNNSDWVNAGRKYVSEESSICPFCQRETLTVDFKEQLTSFFSGEYDANIQLINEYIYKYQTATEKIIELIKNAVINKQTNTVGQVDVDLYNALLDELCTLFKSNCSLMQKKSKEASQKVAIGNSTNLISKISEIIRQANDTINSHNIVVKNYNTEKDKLINDVWTFLLDTNEHLISSYLSDLKGFEKAFKSINEKIVECEKKAEKLELQIIEKNKNITSVQPTVDEINRSLKAYGFTNFQIAQSTSDENSYQIQRMDGTLAADTLSEGEETFITFLYYLQLAKGAVEESKVSSKRILIIDDPISSLDSTILYIVSSMVKSILDDVRNSKSDVEQVFILTHNVFFHKEASFINGRTEKCNDYKYWIINKDDNISRINSFGLENPIKTSYELLWKELNENTNASLVTTQNIMRRILENYFGILGKSKDATIVQSFDSVEEQLICKSLLSWINDGSHIIPDDLYIDSYADSIDRYKMVFKDIFDKMGHIAHYNMMMEIK